MTDRKTFGQKDRLKVFKMPRWFEETCSALLIVAAAKTILRTRLFKSVREMLVKSLFVLATEGCR